MPPPHICKDKSRSLGGFLSDRLFYEGRYAVGPSGNLRSAAHKPHMAR